MTTVWALVANSSFAQIFGITGMGKHITKVHELGHDAGRKRPGEINSDREGRSFGSSRAGTVRHGLGTQVDPHDQEQLVFAKELVHLLNRGREENKFDQIVLVAPPQFLGKLNHAIHDPLKRHVSKEIPKNLHGSLGEQETITHLRGYLDL